MPVFRFFGVSLAIAGCALMSALAVAADFEDGDEAKKWEEVEVHFPPAPKQQNLVGFFVSSTTDNRFWVDPTSISVGGDGVVRYTLVVLSETGVRNITFEGMRCDSRERRLYALGRSDGTWSKSRNTQWERVREGGSNRQYAALFQEYFCPGGVIVRDAEEARDALRRGGYPSTSRW